MSAKILTIHYYNYHLYLINVKKNIWLINLPFSIFRLHIFKNIIMYKFWIHFSGLNLLYVSHRYILLTSKLFYKNLKQHTTLVISYRIYTQDITNNNKYALCIVFVLLNTVKK